jgi:hypothetical protein
MISMQDPRKMTGECDLNLAQESNLYFAATL